MRKKIRKVPCLPFSTLLPSHPPPLWFSLLASTLHLWSSSRGPGSWHVGAKDACRPVRETRHGNKPVWRRVMESQMREVGDRKCGRGSAGSQKDKYYESPRIVKFIAMKSRIAVARGTGSYCLTSSFRLGR